jgi:hypothetical protein
LRSTLQAQYLLVAILRWLRGLCHYLANPLPPAHPESSVSEKAQTRHLHTSHSPTPTPTQCTHRIIRQHSEQSVLCTLEHRRRRFQALVNSL